MTEIWHNPRCSKSRQTLALLEERGIAPTIRLYQQDAPTETEIRAALAALVIPAVALMRSGDALFKDLGLAKDMEEDRLIAAMAAHPALIERPVVLHEGRAALGRPPESVLDLF
ncbi:arsenate reductase (glutaredoxin) [Defluviimonas sp. WL0050]|uniref:Arsenate reductase n=1 Tax=Albidovulum litorale TaxID=2984134 RepID=A0ABT2ZJD1_9RHOB|nr:arsenate reductase (glutaredoxin) [Defluviimonas sp. WL0050]MCV2871241.1 arsenate reductase (glutaredoxin) [Defluviimonas sp. WL0050]